MERKEITNNLKSKGAIYRCNGIVFAASENMTDEETIQLLRSLKSNTQAAIRISFDLSLNTQISYKAYKKRSGRKTFNTPFSESQPKGSIANCPGETRKLIPRA